MRTAEPMQAHVTSILYAKIKSYDVEWWNKFSDKEPLHSKSDVTCECLCTVAHGLLRVSINTH